MGEAGHARFAPGQTSRPKGASARLPRPAGASPPPVPAPASRGVRGLPRGRLAPAYNARMDPSPPALVRTSAGRLEPFDPGRIRRALFAASESLSQPDPFLAGELAEGAVHF